MLRKLEQLKSLLKKRDTGVKEISQELYTLLVSEKDNIQELFRQVELQRNAGKLRLLSGELISDQIDVFSVPEKGVTKTEIAAIREYGKMSREGLPYEGTFSVEEMEKTAKSFQRFLNSGFKLHNRYDAFERRPAGEIAVYDILKQCYAPEIFSSMECFSEEEIYQTFHPLTVNFWQIDWLYKQGKLKEEVEYVAFFLIDEKIVPLTLCTYYARKTFKRRPASFTPKSKLLLFSPLDMLKNEKQ